MKYLLLSLLILFAFSPVRALAKEATLNLINSIKSSPIFYGLTAQRGSFEIDEAFVETYKSNIYMLSQQQDARLARNCRQEQQGGETDYYERLGLAEANKITDRHGDTVHSNTPHTRRAVDLEEADYSDLIDKMDRVKLLINPDDAYVKAAVMGLNRYKDDVWIAAALGNARSGKKGTVNVSLSNSQKVGATNGTASSGLNVFTLTIVLEKFDSNDIDEDIPKYIAYSGKQKQNLLNETEVTSADYNTVRALVQGEIDTFMGFKFIRSERLPITAASVTTFDAASGAYTGGSDTIAAGARRCIAWAEDGMIFATGLDMVVRVTEESTKRFSTQVYAAHQVGAVRMEEEKVVEILCLEA